MSTVMDAAAIRDQLAPANRPAEIPEERADAAIQAIAESARRRMVFNQCGGLPGPPVGPPPTLTYKLLFWIRSRS